jgi:hypothetical protein
MKTLEESQVKAGNPIPEDVIRQVMELTGGAEEMFARYGDTFSAADRQRLVGAGIKSFGFIEAAYGNARANPQFMPPYLKMDAFGEAIADYTRKRELLTLLQQFTQQVSDSMLAASDEAYHYALGYYNSVKEAAKQKVPGAEAEYKLLSPYFKRSKPETGNNQPTEAQIERDVRSLLHGTKEGRVVVENEQPAVSSGKREVSDEVHTGHATIKASVEAEKKL